MRVRYYVRVPVTLHPKARARLVDSLSQTLPLLQVEHGQFLTLDSLLELLPLDDVLPRNLAEVGLTGAFGERPLTHFVSTFVARELERRAYDSEATTVSLRDIPGYEDTHTIAERVVAAFETLPWQYNLFVETVSASDFRGVFGESYELGSDLRLFVPDERHGQRFPLPEKQPLLSVLTGRNLPDKWSDQRYHLEGKVTGFVGRASSREGIVWFASRVKSFAGLLLALELATIQHSPLRSRNHTPILTYRTDVQVQSQEPSWLADEEAREFDSLHSVTGDADPEDALKRRRQRASMLSIPFSTRDERLLNAARWYFDAHCGSNELLSFVQAMIVLEIMFGDKAASDLIGLGQLIANRCAYLIGRTPGEREMIITDVTRIYGTRSAIVHRGKDSLSGRERSDFTRLKTLCEMALRLELLGASRAFLLGR